MENNLLWSMTVGWAISSLIAMTLVVLAPIGPAVGFFVGFVFSAFGIAVGAVYSLRTRG